MNNYNQKPTLKKTFTHWAKRPYLLLLCGLLLALAACGGGEETAATAVPDTPAPQPTNTATAVPPTETPIPPTETPEPTAAPDIAANFITFDDAAGRITFQYPPDWELQTEEKDDDGLLFILTSSPEATDLLGADDYSQPLGFAFGQIFPTELFGTNDPTQILTAWVNDSGLEMTPLGDISQWEEDGVQYASQDFEVPNESGDTLLLTSIVIVNGGRAVPFTYGATAVGVNDYAAMAAAIFDSTAVAFVEPDTKPPDQIADPPPQFEGEMAIIVKEFERYNLATLDMATGQMGPVLAADAMHPAWRPGFDNLTYSHCDGDACAIRVTNREGNLVADEGIRFQYGAWSPDGRYLAFTANPDEAMDIYVYDFGVEPPALRQLTQDSGNNADPVWTDQGNFILFASDRDGDYDIYLMGADGSNQTAVTQNDVLDFEPALAPDSNEMAYVSDVNGELAIFVFDFATREARQLTDNAQSNFSPTWSPDGRYLAYLTREDEDMYQINLILADGSLPPVRYTQLPLGPYFQIAWRPAPREMALEMAGVDFADPASVLQAVFAAAQSGDFSQLAGLCDPLGENDGDTADICAMSADNELAASFMEWFATGQITGEATINGNQAEVPFTFGPNGDEEETMTLIQRNGRWYLFGF